MHINAFLINNYSMISFFNELFGLFICNWLKNEQLFYDIIHYVDLLGGKKTNLVPW
jgi:hypothetical protein